MPPHILRVGLTGGVASGKSAVADMLHAFGAALIDADIVAREVVAPGEAALEAITAEFGREVLDAGGALDRRAMRERVFSDADARARLEALLHPAIRARLLAKIADFSAATAAYLVVVVPLLVETGFAEHVDRVLVVDCPVDIRLRRLAQRDDVSDELAQRMIAAQIDDDQRRAAADDVIDNGGPLVWTRAQAWRTHQQYVRSSKVCRNAAAPAE